jgi:hypothetical protein
VPRDLRVPSCRRLLPSYPLTILPPYHPTPFAILPPYHPTATWQVPRCRRLRIPIDGGSRRAQVRDPPRDHPPLETDTHTSPSNLGPTNTHTNIHHCSHPQNIQISHLPFTPTVHTHHSH